MIKFTLSDRIRNSFQIAAVCIAMVGFGAIDPAKAQTKAASACPASYFRLDTIWYNNANKAIVSTSSGASSSIDAVTDRPGWTLSDLCQHAETGDIQIFDRKPAGTQAAAIQN